MVIKSNNENKKRPRFSQIFIGPFIGSHFCHLSLAKADEVSSKHLSVIL